jgi:hypothetical protein
MTAWRYDDLIEDPLIGCKDWKIDVCKAAVSMTGEFSGRSAAEFAGIWFAAPPVPCSFESPRSIPTSTSLGAYGLEARRL